MEMGGTVAERRGGNHQRNTTTLTQYSWQYIPIWVGRYNEPQTHGSHKQACTCYEASKKKLKINSSGNQNKRNKMNFL